MKLKHSIPIVEVASLIQATIKGNTDLLINGINEIHKVVVGDLTFADHPKYYAKALQSAASCVLLDTDDVEVPEGKTALICPHPFDAYNQLVQHFAPVAPPSFQQHASYYIGQNSFVHPSAQIFPGVVIGSDVHIDAHTVIHPNVTIYDRVHIGQEVIIHANSTIGADAFYYKKKADGYDRLLSCGEVVIEDKVEIGAACTVDKGVSGKTQIGYGTKIDNQVHIAHGCVIGKHCLIAAQVGIAGKTILEDHVTLWGQVGVSKDLTIGEGAILLAQSGVSKSLKGKQVYFGSPAREARKVQKEMVLVRQLPKLVDEWRKR